MTEISPANRIVCRAPETPPPRIRGSAFTVWIKRGAIVLFTGCLSLASHAQAVAIDTHDALVLGPLKISAYRVEKNFRRFSESTAKPDHGPAEIGEWFTRFFTQQVITMAALREGYGQRREVTGEIDRMERHMLSQPVGPLYQKLLAEKSDPTSIANLALIYEKQKAAFEIEVFRLPQSAPTAGALRRILKEKPSGEWDEPVASARSSDQAEYFAGTSQWPFAPFEEIAPALADAPSGVWQQFFSEENILLYRVHRRLPVALPPLETIAPVLQQSARQMAERELQNERKSRALHSRQFAFDWSAATKLATRLHELAPDPAQLLHLTDLPDLASGGLGQYLSAAGSPINVSVADFCGYHNTLFIRKIPATSLEIYLGCRDLVAAQCDCDEARALGLDQEPKFKEDRENYRNFLALDLYEKELVRPKLSLTDGQIAAYYHDHQAEFSRPAKIAGQLLTFTSAEEAREFVGDALAHRDPLSSRAKEAEEIVLAPDSSVPGLPSLATLAFSPGLPGALGPFPRQNAYVVWVVQKFLDRTTVPLASAAPRIRTQLENLLLPAYEAELAQTLARDLTVEDHIDYRKFGATQTIVKPWSS